METKIEAVRKQGYGRGSDLRNTLIIGETGPVNDTVKFPDEPVRHKVLDLLGDLFLLGGRIQGRVIAVRSGHALHVRLIEKLRRLYYAGSYRH